MFTLIKKTFSLDLRSLALFRVCVALILIVDFLWTRLPYFGLFYTEKGFLPLKQLFGGDSFWASTSSLNFVSSSSAYQGALFVLALVFFFMLLIGYKTRWALFGSWLLLVSFQSRNFLILNSGDTLFCLMLFWTLCLPLAEYFSIDSIFKEKREKTVFSINSLAFIFQILFVYYFTYLLKTDPIWKSGQGVYYALMLDNFRTVWGDMLLPYPNLMKVLSIITYYIIEGLSTIAFIFLGSWWRLRFLLILVMCGFHLSLGLFLHLGLFSWICIAGWLAFLPSQFWDRISRWLKRGQSQITVYYDGSCVFCKKMVFLIREFLILPYMSFQPAELDKKAFLEMEKRNSWLVWDKAWSDRWLAFVKLVSYSPLLFWIAPLLKWKVLLKWGDTLYGIVAKNRQKLGSYLNFLGTVETGDSKGHRRVSSSIRGREFCISTIKNIFFTLCFLYVLMWNIRTLDFNYYARFMPRSWNGPGAFFHLHQYWNMFAPKPLNATGWIMLSAEPTLLDSQKKQDVSDEEVEGLIDLWLKGAPLKYEKPERYDMTFPVFRIRKMMENLTLKHKRYSRHYLQWLCRKWNKKERQIKSIQFIYMQQIIPPYGQALPKPKKVVIRKTTC